MFNRIKKAIAKFLGKSIEVTYLALPPDDLTQKFYYKIGKDGKWNYYAITVQALMMYDKKIPPVVLHLKRITDPGKSYHYKILRKPQEVMAAAKEINIQEGNI